MREGYVFEGWYSDPGFKTLYNFSAEVTMSMIIYAKWEKYSNKSKILSELAEVMENSHADDLILIYIRRDSTTSDFIDMYVNKSRAVFYQGIFTGTIILEATSAEIVMYAGLDEVSELTFAPRIPDKNEEDAKYWTVEFDTSRGSTVASQIVESGATVKKPKDPTREGIL